MQIQVFFLTADVNARSASFEGRFDITGIACETAQKERRVVFEGNKVKSTLLRSEILIAMRTPVVVIETDVLAFWALHRLLPELIQSYFCVVLVEIWSSSPSPWCKGIGRTVPGIEV